jgi:predicted RNA-binding Zn ribbon-like protein
MDRQDLVEGRAQSGGREPAEGELRLVQDFVNTVDRENGVELLDGPEGLAMWLDHRGFAHGRVDQVDVEHARTLREALRAILLANNGGPDPGGAYETLGDVAREARLAPVFDDPRLEPAADGIDAVLGRVVAAAFTAMLDGRWERLKACPRDVCGWVFHDRSPANRGTWCSMRVCGNRVKANAYYRRRAGAPERRAGRPSAGSAPGS